MAPSLLFDSNMTFGPFLWQFLAIYEFKICGLFSYLKVLWKDMRQILLHAKLIFPHLMYESTGYQTPETAKVPGRA